MGGTDQLAERAQAGDPAAYEQLYAHVAERLLMYIQLRLGPRLREALEPVDILQDAYLEAHRSFARFEARGPAAFARWMFRIVDHRIRDQADRVSTRKRTAPSVEDAGAFEQVRGALPGPATRAGSIEERAVLVEAIQSLAEEPRALLLEHYFHGQTAADIASATGQTDRHVRRLLRAAETELGRALQRMRNLGAEAPDATELGAKSIDAQARGAERAATPNRIGRYVVRGELGRGAIGVVLRAQDERTKAEVAGKLLCTDEPSARRRFEREARALLKLSHPNIVGILDVGDHEGSPYLVIALVEGPSLHARLAERGPLAVGAAVALAAQLARALEHAHGLGVLHRDIKPQNVLLQRGESLAVLTDFSLAKLIDPGQSQLSVHGQQLGTEGYWPPEQARGDLTAIGPASDVYGLGATLYAMLTGSPPFRGATVSERIRATLQDVPAPPSSLRADVPAALDALCLRCLEKTPARRFQTAGELARALVAPGVTP